METGTVAWFNPEKGFGFITPTNGGADVFVHMSSVERSGRTTLVVGETVEYVLTTEHGKASAALQAPRLPNKDRDGGAP